MKRNPFDEYESQKHMAVRRVTNVALIDRMIVYGRSLEERNDVLTQVEERVSVLFDKVAPANSIWVDEVQALDLIIDTLKGEPDGADN